MYKLKMTLKNKSHFQFCFEFALRTMERFFEHWQHNPWGLQLVCTFYSPSHSTRNQYYDNTGRIISVKKSVLKNHFAFYPVFLIFFYCIFFFISLMSFHFLWLQCMYINQELVSLPFSSSSVNFFPSITGPVLIVLEVKCVWKCRGRN